MGNKKIFGLQRNVFFLGFTSFFNDFSSEMVLSIFPAFFVSVLKSGAEALGLTEGIAEAASSLIKIYSGRWSDRIQKRKAFAVAGYSLSVLARPFYIFAGNVGAVIGLRLTDRIGKGLRDSPRDALISLSTPKEEMGKAFGYHRAMDTLGAIAGPLVAYFFLLSHPLAFNSIFIFAFFIGIAAVISLALVRDIRAVISEKNRGMLGHFSKSAYAYFISIFILSLGTLPLTVLLLKTRDAGFALASIPLFYAIYNISYAVLSLPAGKTADRWGTRIVIIWGYVFLILGYVVLSVSSSLGMMIAGFLLMGLFSAFTDGVQRSHLSYLVDEESRGAAYGYLNACVGFGVLIAGIGGGYIWQVYGDTAALLAGAAVLLFGLLVFWYSGRKL